MNEWKEISTFDFSRDQFVLVFEGGAVRLYLWNKYRNQWEKPGRIGISEALEPFDECRNPTHWMPIPETPDEQ